MNLITRKTLMAQYSRRQLVAGMTLLPLIMTSTANANPLAWAFRLLLRAGSRRGVRALRPKKRPKISPISKISNAAKHHSRADKLFLGYTALEAIPAFAALSDQIVGVANHVAYESVKHQVDMLWIAGTTHRVQIFFLNDSEHLIPAPEVYFEQVNLETGDQRIRLRPLIFAEDWLPGRQGTIPAPDVPEEHWLPCRINETGPLALRPFIYGAPDVIFDDLLIQVASPGDIQWA